MTTALSLVCTFVAVTWFLLILWAPVVTRVINIINMAVGQ